jgi:hypothetical protein
MAPIVGVPAVVLECKDPNLPWDNSIIDRIRETRHEIAPHLVFDNAPSFGRGQNNRYSLVNCVQELGAQRRDLALVNLGRFSQLSRGLGMLDYLHPIARRAAFSASSWLIPATAPAESSLSRRNASCNADSSSDSGNPASMLCQRACANDTFSAIGSAIASAVICLVDIRGKWFPRFYLSTRL